MSQIVSQFYAFGINAGKTIQLLFMLPVVTVKLINSDKYVTVDVPWKAVLGQPGTKVHFPFNIRFKGEEVIHSTITVEGKEPVYGTALGDNIGKLKMLRLQSARLDKMLEEKNELLHHIITKLEDPDVVKRINQHFAPKRDLPHTCVGCGVPLDAEDKSDRCEECALTAREEDQPLAPLGDHDEDFGE
jgi:hypothetical protein